MKTILILIFTIMLSSANAAEKFAVGGAIGSIWGATGEIHHADGQYIDWYVGNSFRYNKIHLVADYMLLNKDAFNIQAYNMNLAYGGGIKYNQRNNQSDIIDIRANVELSHIIDTHNLKPFTALAVNFLGQDIDWILGLKYLF